MPHVIVGTAGHIDHGKTSLVKALTGIDTDRLEEEKARGITIDLGFASLALDVGTTLGFVDVPGHERFIRNMLAGVGGIDLVVLVVAADESVMPQTREHLDICSLLRIRQGLTVLTKIDTTDPEIVDLAELEVQELVRGTFLEGAPILRVSSHTGAGLPRLLEALRDQAGRLTPKDADQIFRLPIDRAFTMKGFGTVVSGTLVAGRVQRDQEIEILPGALASRVRGIQVHGATVTDATAGQRTALNLQRLEVSEIERGMVAVPPGTFTTTSLLDVQLELLPTAPPMGKRKRVRFHVGTAELMGHVVLIGRDQLEPGGVAMARIRLERPAFALPGDRFIVRQYSPMATLGGGEILDAHPRRHRRAGAAARERLERMAQLPMGDKLLALVEEAGLLAAAVPDLVGRLGLTPAQVVAQLQALARDGRITLLGDSPPIAVPTEAFDRLGTAVVDEVGRFHASDPLLPGIAREELKGRLFRDGPAVAFRAAIDRLVAAKQVAVDQDLVRLFDRTLTLGIEDARTRDLLLERYGTLGLQAPAIDDVIASLGLDRQKARQIVQLLLKSRHLVKVGEDVAVDRHALDTLVADVRALKVRTATLGVHEFKELTGLSRKFAVPLLEYLDSQRITRRRGDAREIL